jgi:beta-phosphoglucomutase-like phosphatase (HAD superfamily)
MRAEDLLLACDHVLVAFDGPVAELPVGDSTADRLRVMVADGRLPRKVARTRDPFVVLAHAATIGPATHRAVYAQLCRIEHELVAAAEPTAGVHDAMAALAAAGTEVTVVSGLAGAPVRTFLVMHGLDESVRHIAARQGPDRTVLPPAPDLITTAIHERAKESHLFVGSTDIDLTAARAAGVDTIRHRRTVPEPPAPPPPCFEALTSNHR